MYEIKHTYSFPRSSEKVKTVKNLKIIRALESDVQLNKLCYKYSRTQYPITTKIRRFFNVFLISIFQRKRASINNAILNRQKNF